MKSGKSIPSDSTGQVMLPGSLDTVYTGSALHAIDGSKRILLGGAWRGPGFPSEYFVILAGSDDHLVVCPPAVFASFVADMRQSAADKSQIPGLERELNGRTRKVVLDKQGRLPLPTEFVKRMKMGEQGALIGRFSKFEVWPGDKYPISEDEVKPASPEMSKLLQTL